MSCEGKPSIYFSYVGYSCGLCDQNTLLVFYQKLDFKPVERAMPKVPMASGLSNRMPALAPPPKMPSVYHDVRKIGQVPPPSIDVPSDLAARLGATATYYKQALTCLAHGLGLAAVAYMRRVVEEKTDELIDVVVELARTYNADENLIKELQGAKTQVRYEDKLRVASELIPESMRPGGVNPLGQLYTHLSVGVHGKTDDECVGIFNELKDDFEFVFRNLHIQAEERRAFAARVQSRAGKKL